MSVLQAQFEKETGHKRPKAPTLNYDEWQKKARAYWEAYAKWLEPKVQPKAKPATPPPSDDTKTVIDSHYFQDGRECFERRIAFTAFDNFASIKTAINFLLLSPRGRLVSLTYNVHEGKIIGARFEYWADTDNEGLIKTDIYSSDPYFGIELQSDGGGNYYQETIVMFKNTDATMEYTT